jgi:hypothetical protein
MISCIFATKAVTLQLGYDPGMREPLPPACHSAYRDITWLRDWLNGAPGYPNDRIRVPFMQRLNPTLTGRWTGESETSVHTLTKRKAAGLAPYVGDPFIYTWYVATDELGRSVAGDATIQPL